MDTEGSQATCSAFVVARGWDVPIHATRGHAQSSESVGVALGTAQCHRASLTRLRDITLIYLINRSAVWAAPSAPSGARLRLSCEHQPKPTFYSFPATAQGPGRAATGNWDSVPRRAVLISTCVGRCHPDGAARLRAPRASPGLRRQSTSIPRD